MSLNFVLTGLLASVCRQCVENALFCGLLVCVGRNMNEEIHLAATIIILLVHSYQLIFFVLVTLTLAFCFPGSLWSLPVIGTKVGTFQNNAFTLDTNRTTVQFDPDKTTSFGWTRVRLFGPGEVSHLIKLKSLKVRIKRCGCETAF